MAEAKESTSNDHTATKNTTDADVGVAGAVCAAVAVAEVERLHAWPQRQLQHQRQQASKRLPHQHLLLCSSRNLLQQQASPHPQPPQQI